MAFSLSVSLSSGQVIIGIDPVTDDDTKDIPLLDNLLAHWDFNDGTQDRTEFANDNETDCVHPTVFRPVGLTASHGTSDSRGGGALGANCYFSGWQEGGYVEFGLTFANEAFGDLEALEFDLTNYGRDSDPTAYRVEAFKNGVSQGFLTSTNSETSREGYNAVPVGKREVIALNPWTGDYTQSFDLSRLDFGSEEGVTDTYTFQISAIGGFTTFDQVSALGFDNVQISGRHECGIVPEPSSALLGSISLLGLLRRRR